MKISLKNILLIGAAIFAAYNIGMVGAFIEGKPAGSVSVGGLFGGAVVSISLAISSANIAGVRGQKRTKYAEGFYFFLLVAATVTVAIVIWYDLESRSIHPFPRFLLSILYPALADVAIATAGNITGSSFVTFGEQKKKTNTKRTKANKNEQKDEQSEQKPNKTNAKETQSEQNSTNTNKHEHKLTRSEQKELYTKQVAELLKKNPNANERDIVKETAIKSTSTASRYKKYVEEMK